jgi:hypothetical protein
VQAPTIKIKSSRDIFEDFVKPLQKREGFIASVPTIPVYFYRYIGIDGDENAHYNAIFRLDRKLAKLGSRYLRVTAKFPTRPDPSLDEQMKAAEKDWNEISVFNNTNVAFVAKMFTGSQAIPRFGDKALNRAIPSVFESVLALYEKRSQAGTLDKLKPFCLRFTHWINTYVPRLFSDFKYADIQAEEQSGTPLHSPKVLYYSTADELDVYFLIFLSRLGCDVLYIDSMSDGPFAKIDGEQEHSMLMKFEKKTFIKRFPKQETIERQETTAYKASEEIKDIIFSDDGGVYKPWQLEKYKVRPATLKTTYEELLMLWNEEARVRTGFGVDNDTVYLPNLFAKVSGVTKDLDEYWEQVDKLISSDKSYFIKELPFTKVDIPSQDAVFNATFRFSSNGLLDRNKIVTDECFPFSYLKSPLRLLIVDKINELVTTPILNPNLNISKGLVLLTIFGLDKAVLRLLQTFDFPFAIPKLIIYDNRQETFSTQDAIVVAFLYLIGFDIVLLTPPGYSNIEDIIPERFYDTHRLADVAFDLALPDFEELRKKKRPGFFKRLFS